MALLTVENLNFTYEGADSPTLRDISVDVEAGEFITLCGLSGCGKSTFLRQMKTALAPHGIRCGTICYNGQPLSEWTQAQQAAEIGFVLQSPDYQTVTDKVWHELAFGPESLGYSREEIRRRSAEIAAFFGIEDWYHKEIAALSGGQRQILNLASVMMTSPKLLILDEPVAQLDPIAAEELMQLLCRINRELGTAIIMSAHDLQMPFTCSDRIWLMSEGTIVSAKPPAETAEYIWETDSLLRCALPVGTRLHAILKQGEKPVPITVSQIRRFLADYLKDASVQDESLQSVGKITRHDKPLLEIKDIRFRYERSGRDILRAASLQVRKGEIVCVTGGNGSGKTTLLKAAAGLLRPYGGQILYNGGKIEKSEVRCVYLPQNPQALFACESVYEELYEVAEKEGLDTKEQDELIAVVSDFCGLSGLWQRHPYDLSGGEQQRTALAKALLTRPGLLLLDEPVKGTDIGFRQRTGELLRQLSRAGVGILMVSHDMDFCACYADRCTMLFDGQTFDAEDPHDFFCGNHFYTTQARRISEGLLPHCVTEQDILNALGKTKPSTPPEQPPERLTALLTQQKEPVAASRKHRSKIKRKMHQQVVITPCQRCTRVTAVTLSVVFAAVPLTILLGITWLNDTKYLFISLLILLECMIPFMVMFEKRRIRTRELVMIAGICALCVAARTVFYMLPEFKPLTAMVIMAGAALGAESGFLIGACSMLCSNILFGQGPWTPWQMFAMGLIGLLAGLFFNREHSPKHKTWLALFGFFAALVIYGGIMDPAAAIMSHVDLTPQTVAAYYLAGLPLDCIHAVSTALFLMVGAVPVMRKLDRIKKKYGLIDVK